MVYHNITPAAFFQPYNTVFAELLETGRKQTALLLNRFDLYVADSDYNADELREMGAKNVWTMPVVVDFSRFDRAPNRCITGTRDSVDALFVGRISPSKGLANLVDAFEALLCFDRRAHLTIVGRYDANDAYFRLLREMITERRMDEAITFAGVVDEATLLAYYQKANVYLCFSEHEGFCVPLVEAMFFDVPVLALASTAIPETMGSGGLLFTGDMDNIEIAATMYTLVTDVSLRWQVIEAQRERRRFYFPEVGERRIDELVLRLLS